MALEKIRPRVVDATGDYTFNNVTATGNLVALNANLGNLVTANYVKTDNLLFSNGAYWPVGGAGATLAGANTQVQFNDSGSFAASSNFTFNKGTNTLTVTNIAANGAGLTSLTGANVNGTVANATYATSAGTATTATNAGTVTTNAQPNITSVGSLSTLTVTGNLVSGNADLGNSTTSNYYLGNGYFLSSVSGGNVLGQVAYAGTANSVSGSNVVGAVTYASTANAVSGSNVMGQVGNALLAGTVYTNAQPNITSVGILTSLDVTGNVSANYFIGNGSQLTGITFAGAYSNTNTAAYLTANPPTGTYSNSNVAAYLPTYTGNLSANYFIGNGSTLTNITGANIIGNAPFAGTANYANTANSILGTNVSGNVTSAVQSHYANIANSITFANVSGTPTTISGYGILDAYSNTNTAAYLSANPVTGTYSNANVAAYLPTYTGNLTAGNINLSYTTTSTANLGNVVRANYFIGDGSLLTGVDVLTVGFADIANSIANGTSNINTPYADGPITVGIGGAANTVVFTSTGINVAGYSNIGGTVTAGTGTGGSITGANAITSNYFIGNGSLLTGITGTYSNTNVASYLPTYSGDLSSANLTITGNLIVGGTTTSVNSTVTRIVDPVMELGGGANGTALSSDDNKDRGLVLHYYSGASAVDAFMGWDDSNAEFAFASNASFSSEVATFNSFGNVRASYFKGDGSQLTNINSGAITGAYSNSNVATYLPTYTGNLTAGNINLSYTTTSTANLGNVVRANYFIGDGSLLTGVDVLTVGSAGFADIANSIANGTSNINTPYVDGPITVGIGGAANAVVFTSTGINVAGYSNIGGTVTAGTGTGGSITGANAITSNYFIGNGSYLTSITGANVTGYVPTSSLANTVTTNAQPNITSVGTLTSLSVTGNVSANYFIGNGSQLTGITSTYSNTNTAAYLTANPPTGTYSNSNVAAYLPTYTGNLTAGNINLSYTTTSTANLGNSVRANYFVGNGAYLTGVDLLTVGNADIANSIANGTSNINTTVANGNITVTIGGTANTVVFANTGNYITTTGNVSASYLFGNGSQLTGVAATSVTGGNVSGNVSTANIAYYVNVTANSTNTSSFLIPFVSSTGNSAVYVDTTANDLSYQPSSGNLTAAYHIGNGYYLTGVTATATLPITSGTSNINIASGGNATVSIGGTSNVLVVSTSGLTVAANVDVGVNYFKGNGFYLTGVDAAGKVSNGSSNLNIITNSGNISMGVGGTPNVVIVSSSGINVAGSANITGIISSNSNVSIGSAGYFVGNGYYLTGIGSPSYIFNGISNANIGTANGNFTLGINGTANVVVVSNTGINLQYTTSAVANLGNLVTANYVSGNGNLLTSLTGANVTGQVGNALLAGTVYTNAQPNITSVGTLTSLTVTGLTNLGTASNITIGGGAANYFLKTDGAGNLSWAATSGGGGGGTSLTYTTATSPPATGNLLGDQWFNTSSNVLYEYISDGSASYWVDISGATTTTNTGVAGTITIKDEGSNLTTAVTSINFVGAGVTASNVGNAVTVTVVATESLSPFMLMGA